MEDGPPAPGMGDRLPPPSNRVFFSNDSSEPDTPSPPPHPPSVPGLKGGCRGIFGIPPSTDVVGLSEDLELVPTAGTEDFGLAASPERERKLEEFLMNDTETYQKRVRNILPQLTDEDSDGEGLAIQVTAKTPQSSWAKVSDFQSDGMVAGSAQTAAVGMRLGDVADIEDNGIDFFSRIDSDQVLFEAKKKKPKMIEKYLIGEKLGEGSYGKVKEALDSETLCRRAVKILKLRKFRRLNFGNDLLIQKEIKLLQRLSHANVVRLFDVCFSEEKQKLYLFMDCCVGSLQEMLETSTDKKFPTWQSHRYFVQLISGLEYLHSQALVHKDIKPGNLLLTVEEILKITDFGVAEELDHFAADNSCRMGQGTPTFQPPEITRPPGPDSSGSADGHSQRSTTDSGGSGGRQTGFNGFLVDVWSTGVTLYNMCSGTYPFTGQTLFELYDNIAKKPLQIPTSFDKMLEDLLRGMLAKSPSNRLTLSSVRTHDWTRLHHQIFPEEKVPLPPLLGDPLRDMTVMPYLEQLYGEPDGNEGVADGQLFTARDLQNLAVQDSSTRAQSDSDLKRQNQRSLVSPHGDVQPSSSATGRLPLPSSGSADFQGESSAQRSSSRRGRGLSSKRSSRAEATGIRRLSFCRLS